jgi:hypothetical protein
LSLFNNIFSNNKHSKKRKRFNNIIKDKRFNYLESIFIRIYDNDKTLTDKEIVDAYYQFSNKTQTNTFSAAELEWVVISVLCYFHPNLTEKLTRRGLLSTVYSLGDDIDWFTVKQFIERRILSDKSEPYGGLPPTEGQLWLRNLLPSKKDIIQKVLEDVVKENRKELD